MDLIYGFLLLVVVTSEELEYMKVRAHKVGAAQAKQPEAITSAPPDEALRSADENEESLILIYDVVASDPTHFCLH
jgi:hypothetical protein